MTAARVLLAAAVPLALALAAAAMPPPALPSAGIPGCSAEAARARQPLPHGCATALNLEAMVAEPSDLVSVRTLSPATGEAAVAPVRRLRQGSAAEPAPRPTTAPGP